MLCRRRARGDCKGQNRITGYIPSSRVLSANGLKNFSRSAGLMSAGLAQAHFGLSFLSTSRHLTPSKNSGWLMKLVNSSYFCVILKSSMKASLRVMLFARLICSKIILRESGLLPFKSFRVSCAHALSAGRWPSDSKICSTELPENALKVTEVYLLISSRLGSGPSTFSARVWMALTTPAFVKRSGSEDL